MNEMRTASMQFAAYFVNSAERTSITTRRSRLRLNGAYISRSVSVDRWSWSCTPTMMRSGFMKSATAKPSFRNSGLEAVRTPNATPRCFNSRSIASRTMSLVPTGTSTSRSPASRAAGAARVPARSSPRATGPLSRPRPTACRRR